jgi:hypothetical protein
MAWERTALSLLLYAMLGIGVLGISGLFLGVCAFILRVSRIPLSRVPPRVVRRFFIGVPCVVLLVSVWVLFVSSEELFLSRSPDGRYVLRVGEVMPAWDALEQTKLVLTLRDVETGRTVMRTTHVTREFRSFPDPAGDPEAIQDLLPVEWGEGGHGRGVLYIPHEALAVLLPAGSTVTYLDLGEEFDPLIREYLDGEIAAADVVGAADGSNSGVQTTGGAE